MLPDYKAELKQHLLAAVDQSRAAQSAMEEAAKYWSWVNDQIPNPKEPNPLIHALKDLARALDGLATKISQEEL
jgi:hypothetical protein